MDLERKINQSANGSPIVENSGKRTRDIAGFNDELTKAMSNEQPVNINSRRTMIKKAKNTLFVDVKYNYSSDEEKQVPKKSCRITQNHKLSTNFISDKVSDKLAITELLSTTTITVAALLQQQRQPLKFGFSINTIPNYARATGNLFGPILPLVCVRRSNSSTNSSFDTRP
ncbi:2736_t:CDS:2 [Ambispora gerdemannii]|uniref:2736_t:CDS:1 n=1 Tax=Ambispora gerdemannii TaxID=144530 RepID=A0A9N9FP76_9GLOM|nr:2736_t:CDS:2 [Ambispora gerdemannii]